jgi:hypothetical protein
MPPPEGSLSPMTWGVASHVRERFAAAGVVPEAVGCAREAFVFDVDGPPAQLVAEFRDYYGPTMNAFDAAAKSGRADALQAGFEALFTRQNKSGCDDRTLVSTTFLRVTVAVS